MISADLHARALEQLVAGDTAGGITDLRAHLAARPDDVDAWLALGAAYASIEHPAQAEGALARAVDGDGARGDARLAYGRALVRLGKLDAAAAQLEAATQLDPADARALEELAVLRYDQRRHDEAAALLERAVALAPAHARAWYALGVVQEARRDIGAAVAAYRAAVERDPTLTDARRTLADALASLGEHEAALAELEAVLAQSPADEQAARNCAVLEQALVDLERRRLLGKGAAALEGSTLLTAGGLRREGAAEGEGVGVGVGVGVGERTARYAAPLVEVYATFAAEGGLEALLLVLTDPARAARAAGDAFAVTVVTRDGRRVPADLGTALTLTLLREALGCPLTTASALYARLLGGAAEVTWGAARVAFDSVPRHGLKVRRRDR